MGLRKLGEVKLAEGQRKLDWDKKLLKEEQEEDNILINLVTYSNDLVEEWRLEMVLRVLCTDHLECVMT